MNQKVLFNNTQLNNFFRDVSIKKQYINKLKKQWNYLQSYKQINYKLLYSKSLQQNYINNYHQLNNSSDLILYIIDITFSKSNTLLHVMNPSGKVIFFCSAGNLNFEGKRNKKRRFLVFKSMYNMLLTKLRFLKTKPIALHLKNVSFNKFWIIKKLKTKFFIKVIKNFTVFPYNGCRKKKVKRKKFRTKKQITRNIKNK